MKSFNRGLPPLTPPLRDVSFSAYLPPEDLNYAPKKESPAAAAAAMADDSEISIFDAEKYFNECSTDQHQHKESTRVAPVGPEQHCEPRPVTTEGYGRNYSSRSFHATPTVSSEASWNSQTGLLRNPPGSIGVNMRMRSISSEHGSVNMTGRKWFFRRKCPCSGKKDVEIKEKVSEQQPIPSPIIGGSKKVTDKLKTNNPQQVVKKSAKSLDSSDWALPADRPDHDRHLIPQFPPPEYRSTQLAHRVLASGPGFSFPILSQPPPVKMVFTAVRNPIPMEDPRRDSLEIFRPSASAAAADIIPPPRIFAPNAPDRRSFTFSASPKSRCAAAVDDDVASDASSDLFEIESFTTQTTTTTATATSYPMYHRRDSLDEASRRYGYEPPTEGYEPSEASIDWSVTTAEGFDRGSVTNFSVSASEVVDDVTLMRHELQRLGNGGGFDDNGGGGGRRRGNGMLMSCRCEKAVSVGPTPTPVKEGQGGTYKHVSSRDRMIGVGKNKPPLPRSHSARLSLTFAT